MAQQLGLSPVFGDSNPSENEALEEPEPASGLHGHLCSHT